jgi:hypothetical protein
MKPATTSTKDAAVHGPQIVQALDTIAHAILGDELQSLRQSIGEQDAKVLERVEAVRKELSEIVANLKNDLHRTSAETRLKLSESEENQQKALLDLGDRTDKWMEGVKKEVHDALRSAGEKLEAAKSATSEQLAAQGKKLEERIEAVSKSVTSLQQELRQQQESSQRFGALLNNLGAVFGATPPNAAATAPPTGVPEAKRDSARPARAAGQGGDNQADLDRALDEAFNRSAR